MIKEIANKADLTLDKVITRDYRYLVEVVAGDSFYIEAGQYKEILKGLNEGKKHLFLASQKRLIMLNAISQISAEKKPPPPLHKINI